MYRSQFEDIDWANLVRRLRILAKSLTFGAQVTFDCGLSHEDLVSETLEAFLKSETALGWDPSRGVPLYGYLGRILERKFIDHIRRQKHVAGSFDDGRPEPPDRESQDNPTEYDGFVSRVLEIIKGDQELEEFVLATAMTDGGHNINQQLADELKTTTSDIVNRKKRLLNNQQIRKLYEQRRKAKQSGS